MEFEWDEQKRAQILEDRALDFGSAQRFFDGRPTIHRSSPRNDEERWKTTAAIEGAFFTVVWTWRGGSIRIITMRRAHEKEIRAYRAVHGR
jgi:uncharacterized DUF497 family protein